MEKFEASVVNYLCPICGNIAQEGIIMNSLLTKDAAKEVKDLNGKTLGFANHACKKCAEYKDKVVYYVGIDPNKGTTDDIYRTGQIVGVRPDSPLVKECEKYIKTLKDGSKFCLIAENAGIQVGLWK